jgi:hypothetical protein
MRVFKRQTLVARFANAAQAEAFIAELREAGLAEDEIRIVEPRKVAWRHHILAGCRAGALAGLVLGAFTGIYLTGGLFNAEPLLQINPLLAILGGAIVCAVAGIIAGGLVSSFIRPEEAGIVPSDTLRGGTAVVVCATDAAHRQLAQSILQRHHAAPLP